MRGSESYKMAVEYKYSFSFKGNRDYIQGPDIIDDSLALLSKDFNLSVIEAFKYSGHEMLKRNAIGILNSAPKEAMNSLIAFKYLGSTYYLSIIDDGRVIDSKVDFSEELISKNLIIYDSACEMPYESGFTLTEQLVSMNKHFLQKTVSKEGKWIITKLEYPKITEEIIKPTANSLLSIHLEKNMQNKLTRSIIKYNNNNLGTVFFSLV